MDTGYWINGGKIYGPVGFTGFYIRPDHRITGRKGYTRHWIYQGQFYSQTSGNTWFRVVDENRIHGPEPEPPWVRPTH